jgi:hypothetical protein
MRFVRILAGVALVSLAVAFPLSAVEPSAAPESPQAAEIALPAELESLLTPAPQKRFGWKNGPCNIQITCLTGATLGCSGQSYCHWKYDAPGNPGFVECDHDRISCLN